MSKDNKKQNEPEEQKELTSADVKQAPGGARDLSADELQKIAGGMHKGPPPKAL